MVGLSSIEIRDYWWGKLLGSNLDGWVGGGITDEKS